jgi:putative flavoprotein involved in K+ transport
LPDGAVLVVGSAMSGCQIAEELYLAGRKVYLATGTTGRAPRRYRGKDTVWWMTELGFFDLTIEEMPPGTTRFDSVPHLSGAMGGRTLNLHRFARDGVTLLGRLQDTMDTSATFAPNLHDNLASADAFERMVTDMIDGYIAQQGLDAPPETLPELRDGFDQPIIERLDLDEAGVTSVIWATGYSFDYSLVKLPVFDADGYPIQDRGVTAFPGISFAGLPWMPTDRTGSLLGIGEFTEHLAATIAGALVPG